MYLVRFLCKRRIVTRLCFFFILSYIVVLLVTWLSFISFAQQNAHVPEKKDLKLINNKPDVYTYDLPDITNYSFVKGKRFKEYVIPVLSETEAAYGPSLDPLTVLLIPFSHVDPGFGNTMEGYYNTKTRNTLNHMVNKLDQYRNMTFQWTETVFLERWWRDINEDVKSRVRGLIQRGQLEIVLGGWVMPDEASTHYVSVIDQLIEGHQWLIENLGVKPRNSWSNDPFGFSSTMPYLWKKAGMENMVILRIHQAIKATLMKLKTMEFNWRQLWSDDTESEILCHLMPYRGYWIGDVCGPYNQHICREYAFHRRNPVDKVIFITAENVAERSRILYEQYRITAEIYRRHGFNGDGRDDGTQLFLPMFLGEDFSYTSADEFDLIYTNFKMIFDYINSKQDWKMNIKFGTLKEYFSLIRQYQSERSRVDASRFPVLAGDFFPYSDYQNDYWTGYYTTRPFNKQLSRELQSTIRLADLIHVYAYAHSKTQASHQYPSYADVTSSLRDARRELGMFLHHDGITGTSVLPVIQDFQRRLFSAYNKARTAMRLAVSQLLTLGTQTPNDSLLSDATHRITEVSISQPENLNIHTSGSKILVINPSGSERKEVVSFMTLSQVTMTDSSNNIMPVQLNGEPSKVYRVSFVTTIPPFGIESFLIKSTTDSSGVVYKTEIGNDFVIANSYLSVEFDKDSGFLSGITDQYGTKTYFQTVILAYTSLRSGAYIFAPTGTAGSFLGDKPDISISRGSIVSEITAAHKGFRITASVYHVSGVQGQGVYIRTELDIIDPNSKNKEVIIRFQTDINSRNRFYSDQNGFQLLGRKTYADRPIEQNYYPLTTMAVLEDESRRLTLHTAQPHGVASLNSGWLEVMLDRKVSKDDDKGLGQGVEDNVLTVAQFVLQMEAAQIPLEKQDHKYTFPSMPAVLLNELLVDPLYKLFIKDASAAGVENLISNIHPMTENLPCGVYVVSMRNLAKSNLEYNGTSLILHRKKTVSDSVTSSKDSCVSDDHQMMSLAMLFPKLKIKKTTETSLTHLDDLKEISTEEDIIPLHMELKAFKVEF